ncbi:hypothetical protein MBGDC06_00076 [Thermoplasmatales archaeon SCGC AB-539-C06]|nr:hypothetical protein MBGDC06_00076 [Thermoplasmatales archaeon SCGC AB-539-C06]
MNEKIVFSKSINYIQQKLKDILSQVSQKDIDEVKKFFSILIASSSMVQADLDLLQKPLQ